MTIDEGKREADVSDRLDGMFVLEFVFFQFAIHSYFFRGPMDLENIVNRSEVNRF